MSQLQILELSKYTEIIFDLSKLTFNKSDKHLP
jgi:hypothetical protein